MPPESARDLFARALDLTDDAREAFLAEACGDDAGLRLDVQRLLADAERAESFFANDDGDTIGAEDFEAACAEVEGDRIGPYILRQKIGEGGFGVVWMAEQTEPISRMVALKVVKAGMDTRQVLARFEAERQALAMMDHPNIAKVLDAGATPGGRPYFAMELVKGVPVTQFCDDQRFGPRPRLELFRDVCSAVNHAHQKGIIHRDLKPSNVMVTLAADQPVVKVIDFGIAKATHGKLTEKTLFTRFEQFVGTPVYMSPEQAAMSSLDVDTRSDIYSLGVLLYELLAGVPPFDQRSLLSAGYDEMRRIIREEEPPKPSTKRTQTEAAATGAKKKLHVSAGALKGELDWIVMKAIEKDRTRRYETANAFAADIGRYLNDEPVEAAAPSAAYKFRKFARRNKAALVVAAGMLALLLGGIAATSWQAVRANAERDRALGAEELAGQRLEESEASRKEAEAISGFLIGMFESSHPGDERGGREVKVAEILDLTTEKLENDLADQPGLRAGLQRLIGKTYYNLGLYAEAMGVMEKAYDAYRNVLGPEHVETLRSMADLAAACQASGQVAKSLSMQETILALSRKVRGPEHPETLQAMGNLAGSYSSIGRSDEGLALQEQALVLMRKVNGPEHPDTLIIMLNLASSYYFAARHDLALEMHDELLALSRKVHGPKHPTTLAAMEGLARSYADKGRLDEALTLLEETLKLCREVSGPGHPHTLQTTNALAVTYQDLGRVDEALATFENLLPLVRKVQGAEHPSTLHTTINLAGCYVSVGRTAEGFALFEETLPLMRKELGPEHPVTLWATLSHAAACREAGRHDEALELGRSCYALSRETHGEEHRDTLRAMTELAVSCRAADRLEEAISLEAASLALKRAHLGAADGMTIESMLHLATCYEEAGREAEARELRDELATLKAETPPE